MSSSAVAYKALSPDQWLALQNGTFAGSPIDIADGYIHLSTAAQLTQTVDLHFTGQANLVIAAVDLASLHSSLRWEPSRQGQLFPHIYGVLSLHSIITVCPLERDAQGAVKLPA